MREIRRTAQFKRDAKRIQKRGKRTSLLMHVVEQIATVDRLPAKHRDHPLRGAYRGVRECHIESDWLLIAERTEATVVPIRTGTHADLFDL